MCLSFCNRARVTEIDDLCFGLQIAVGDMVINVADSKKMVSEGRKIIRYKDE